MQRGYWGSGRFAVAAMMLTLWFMVGAVAPRLWAAPSAVVARVPTAVAGAPVEIPEPVTIILFGTGLAAMAAAATVKRKR